MKLPIFFALFIAEVSSQFPLGFEFAKEEPLKTRIYLNPALPVKRIKELSSREMDFVRNNDTFAIEEEVSEWFTMVNNEEPSPRYAFLKNAFCQEKDFRIAWIDSSGKEHDSVIQRLGATPMEWKPEAAVYLKGLRLQGRVIVATIDWTVWQDKLAGFEQLTNIEPIIELISCETLFDKPVPPPTVAAPRKLIYFHQSYADHKCTFTVRLSVMVYDQENECRPILQTAEEKSVNVTVRCDQISGYKCPTPIQTVCKMNCDVKLTAEGDYDWVDDNPVGVVKLNWQIENAQKSSNKGSVIRITELNGNFNNYPLIQSKVEVKNINGSSFNVTPFSTVPEAYYGVQACILYETCRREPKWSAVPTHAIYAGNIVNSLPPPPSPTTTTTTTTTTEPPTTESTTLLPTTRRKPSIHHSSTVKPKSKNGTSLHHTHHIGTHNSNRQEFQLTL